MNSIARLLLTVRCAIGLVAASAHEFDVPLPDGGYVWSIVHAPDGKTIAVPHRNHVYILNSRSGAHVAKISSKSRILNPDQLRHYISCTAYSPDGSLLAGARADGTVSFWSTTTLDELSRFRVSGRAVRAVIFSNDGAQLATAGDDGIVRLWGVQSRKNQAAIERWYREIAYSPDGRLLACGNSGGEVGLWNLHDGRMQATFQASEDDIRCLAFSWDSKTLFVGDIRARIQVWDVTTAKHQAGLQHVSAVKSIVLVKDRNLVVAAAGDGNIAAWDTRTFQKLGSFYTRERDRSVAALSVSPDQKSIFAGGRNGVVWSRKVERVLAHE